ncbi:hypothetical protein H9654_00775 [Stenotrophomonas sp. Sa5BUN4]|uniref:Uncharacterized protein n=1 Tax=Stenotrophomonas lacuserhaii TaxID=2760084 RepID=A0A8X8FPY1_9GAMM|nr:hypothetical protein [Stenotrophomonas pennii]MBD7952725.1 hypothetical protein [Stenotrophomonas pennii]
MNFDTVLNLRTESAGQRGVVILQFVPQQAIGTQQLTLSTAPATAAAMEVGARYNWTAVKVEPGDGGTGGASTAMSFAATLNQRTESASQAGVATLQFLPEASIGAPQLTMTVPLAVSSPLEVGSTYRFEAVKVEEPTDQAQAPVGPVEEAG